MRKFLIRLFISLLIGAGMLYLATTQTSFAGTWEILAAAQWWVLAPFLALMALQHLFRVWRWGYLLDPIAHVPFSRLLPISCVGFLAILALPLRMGELVRPYFIADPPRIRMSHGLGTMAVERVFDGLILSVAAFAAVLVASASVAVPRWIWVAGFIALGLFFVALIVLAMALWKRERAVTICRRMVGVFSPRLADRAASVARGIVEGFLILPDWRRLLLFLTHTLLYWFGNALAVWVLALGFGVPLTIWGSVAFNALTGIGIMVPAGPGFVGNYELFADASLDLYAPALSDRVGGAFIVATHALNALWYIATGLLGLLSSHVTFKKVWTLSTREPEHPAPPAGQPVAISDPAEIGQRSGEGR